VSHLDTAITSNTSNVLQKQKQYREQDFQISLRLA